MSNTGPFDRENTKQKNVWTNAISESMAPEYLRLFYRDSPTGLPRDYNPNGLILVPASQSDLLPPPRHTLNSSLEGQEPRDTDLIEHQKRIYKGDPKIFRLGPTGYDGIGKPRKFLSQVLNKLEPHQAFNLLLQMLHSKLTSVSDVQSDDARIGQRRQMLNENHTTRGHIPTPSRWEIRR